MLPDSPFLPLPARILETRDLTPDVKLFWVEIEDQRSQDNEHPGGVPVAGPEENGAETSQGAAADANEEIGQGKIGH